MQSPNQNIKRLSLFTWRYDLIGGLADKQGRGVVLKTLGWVLRRLFCVKENYFGAFTQFTTMQEFLERFDHDPNSIGDPVEEKYRPGRVSILCSV